MDIASLLSSDDGASDRPSQNSNGSHLQPRKRPRPVVGTRTPSLLSQEILISPSPEPPRSAPVDSPDMRASGPYRTEPRNNPGWQPYPTASDKSQASQHSTGSGGSDSRAPQGQPDAYAQSVAAISNSATPIAEVFGQSSPSFPGQSLQDHRPPSASSTDMSVDSPSLKPHAHSPQPIAPAQRPDLNATRSPSLSYAKHISPLARSHSASASDLVMAEAPAQTPPPRNFTASSISDADLKTINELTSYLVDNSYDYNSHVQLINLLHRGFVAHVDAPLSASKTLPQPSDYSLLKELRMARGAMDSRYSVGEDIWRDWINDESMLAKTSEDRIAVMELCMKAVQEEPASIVLWSLYGEWVWSTYAVANGFSDGDEDTWTEEDKMICKEVFTRDMVLTVWTQAVDATKWRMDESHVVWNRYVELIMQDFPEHPSPQTIEKVQTLYMTRLQVPHATWDATSQAFWPFISKHKSDSWEEIMAVVNELAAPAKKRANQRANFESQVTQAYRQDDKTALYNAYVAYFNWEAKRKSKTPVEVELETRLRCALYERALLRFPTMVEWWLDYVDLLISVDDRDGSILPLLERATRHCPWSGELWSRRLLRVEIETRSYDEVESVKHRATNSGLLPTGGMEEIILVYSAWCSYLRRRAFAPTASDDDVDMADIAINCTLDDIRDDGKKVCGEDFKGDPLWRIEKILIRFLTQAQRFSEARDVWRSLIEAQESSYDFWAKYYDWEILVVGMELVVPKSNSNGIGSNPNKASAVLQEAMKKNLDWPEKIHDLYSHHFHTHESVEKIQIAQGELRRARKLLNVRREREAAAAAEAEAEALAHAQSQAPVHADAAAQIVEDDAVPAKRKREDENANEDGAAVKRNKVSDPTMAKTEHTEQSSPTPAQIKRDREHNTVTVTQLPSNVSEKTLRQFFSDCGTILSINILVDEKDSTATATLEFETHDDVLAAKVRDGKTIDDHEIHVQSGTQSTLYVTNYPPTYAEDDIREIFKDHGSIVSVRFPSLKFNQRRRFCYVTFVTAQEARSATQLHDKVIDGQHRLVALISEPQSKKSRQGATSEGREVHVGNIDFAATEREIRQHFEQAGKVDHVRMIKNANGRFTGMAFVIFPTADEAQQSLDLNQKPLKDRLLRVSIATDKSTRDAANKKHGTTKVFEPNNAASPTANSPSEAASAQVDNPDSADTAHTKRERTIALLDLPDTVNDARIHSTLTPFGSIRKLTIRRDKAGALVEFVNLDDAARASMGADASVLGEGCRVGTPAELLGAQKKKKSTAPKAAESKDKFVKPALVSRPGQARGGRKPGLGAKRATAPAPAAAGEDQGKKSNADFRAMFLAGKGKEGEAETEG